MEKTKCPTCGANTDGKPFCSYCGADVRTDYERKVDKTSEMTSKAFGNIKPFAKRIFIVWGIVATLMISGFIIAVIIMSNKF